MSSSKIKVFLASIILVAFIMFVAGAAVVTMVVFALNETISTGNEFFFQICSNPPVFECTKYFWQAVLVVGINLIAASVFLAIYSVRKWKQVSKDA